MGSLVLTGDTSGSVTVAVPAVAGTNTATFPAATGTVMVSGNMPAFSAYGNTNQVISSGVATKVIINTKVFDTATAYNATTNYRFTPLVAGYYQVNAVVEGYAEGSPITNYTLSLYKNGAEALRGNGIVGTGATEIYATLNTLMYFNGSTDYIELYMSATSVGTITLYASSIYKNFNACLIRAA